MDNKLVRWLVAILALLVIWFAGGAVLGIIFSFFGETIERLSGLIAFIAGVIVMIKIGNRKLLR